MSVSHVRHDGTPGGPSADVIEALWQDLLREVERLTREIEVDRRSAARGHQLVMAAERAPDPREVAFDPAGSAAAVAHVRSGERSCT